MGLVCILIGIILTLLGLKMVMRKPNFELEKTTNGRTVKFLGYDESKKHYRIKSVGRLILLLGIALLGVGIYISFFLDK